MADLREYEVWATTNVHRRLVQRAENALRQAATHGRVAVATSWGKDSVALCDLAIRALGAERVVLVHMASPYELPGGEEVVEHFARRAEVVTLPPTRTLGEYIAWLHDVGLCFERHADPVKALKRDRIGEWCTAHGVGVQAMGLRTEESKARRMNRRIRGLVYQRADAMWTAIPLADWSTEDVWAHIADRRLPYHRLYDCETHGFTRATLRNSGWLTTRSAGEGRIAWLRTHFPGEYRALADAFPRLRLLV